MSDIHGIMHEGGVPQYTNVHQGSPSESPSYQLIPISWLEQKKAWPDHLKAALRDYMLTHQFFNYKSTQHDSCMKLDGISQQLQCLFDQTDWDISIHPAKLKEKVCRQIHKIRATRFPPEIPK
ncbi:hypothetical protein MMC14_001390 [Varicellaria rhodocarpa]|nr:hypothetical protein [Varicellaria rhodocarpa]